MNILNALWPILLALVAGVVFGRLAPQTLCRRLIGMIGPLIWLMLFLIGHEFGEVLFSSGSVGRILGISALFALATTLVPGVLVLAYPLAPAPVGAESRTCPESAGRRGGGAGRSGGRVCRA